MKVSEREMMIIGWLAATIELVLLLVGRERVFQWVKAIAKRLVGDGGTLIR